MISDLNNISKSYTLRDILIKVIRYLFTLLYNDDVISKICEV